MVAIQEEQDRKTKEEEEYGKKIVAQKELQLKEEIERTIQVTDTAK